MKRRICDLLGLRAFGRDRRGMTLVETLVGIAILGLVGIVTLSGVSIASKATMSTEQRSVAESAARAQLEYVKSQNFKSYTGSGGQYQSITVPDPYQMEFSVTNIDPATGLALPADQTMGLQKLTVAVSRYGKEILRLQDHRVDR